MRKAHLLRRLHAQQMPSRIIIVDTETKPYNVAPNVTQNHLWFGWAMYLRRHKDDKWSDPYWHRFSRASDFWDWAIEMTPDKTTTYLFAHNLSFDEQILLGFTEMESKGWTLDFAVLEEPPSILQWSKGTKKIIWLDTLNWFLMSLDKLGSEIGIAKLDMPSYEDTAEQWDVYCRRDVEVLRQALLAWFDRIIEWKLGGFKYTLAAQAFAAFRFSYLNHKIYIHREPKTLALERESYFGGRVEAYRIGKVSEPMFVIDVNSMYPYVMQNEDYPRWYVVTETNVSLYNLRRMIQQQSVTVDCLIQTDEPVYPIKHNGKLVFPIGRFRTVLPTPEAKYALEHGHIVRAYKVAVYDNAPIFRDYVVDMYARRQEAKLAGDTVQNLHTKLMLNSLYGKFGQKGFKWDRSEVELPGDVGIWKVYDMDTRQYETYRAIAGNVFVEKREGEAAHSFPAIAAHVTSAARMILWEAMKHAGRENVFYCDTDSMVLNAQGFQRMKSQLHQTDLGAWSLDFAHTQGEFYGAKDYTIGDRERHKGIKLNAIQIETNVWEQDQFRKIIGGLRVGEIDRQLVLRIRKTLWRIYDKGVVGADGKVTPLILGSTR